MGNLTSSSSQRPTVPVVDSNMSGNNNSDSDSDHDSDSMDLFGEEHHDALNEHYLVLILRQLIDSGELHMVTSEDTKLPIIKKKPSLDKLKKNAIYDSVKQASGYGNFEDKDPEASWSMVKMLSSRENGVGPKHGSFTQFDKCKINNLFIPNHKERTILTLDKKIFCGTMSKDGNNFLTCSQDHNIRIFDASTPSYNLIDTIPAKHVSWSILDVDFSKDGQYFAYSSWSDCLHIVNLKENTNNIDCLMLDADSSRFGAFSLVFSNCGQHIICGASDGHLYSFDRELNRRTLRVPVQTHHEAVDVNAVGFVDESSDIFFSGTEDGIIKVWDRRCLNEARPEAVGLLVGHRDGITFIDSKNDGRYLISNSKDQSIKLWDLRMFSPKDSEDIVLSASSTATSNWDYRWDKVPKRYYSNIKAVDGDTSVMTYRGHRVQKSLIRAKFSPVLTTGQRYIYSGCSSGRLIIYDVLTGKMLPTGGIESHIDIIRDVAWHPYRNEILTSSWDHHVNLNTFLDKTVEKKRPRRKLYSSFVQDRPVPDSDDSDRESEPPLRRSRRIADRNQRNLFMNIINQVNENDSSDDDAVSERSERTEPEAFVRPSAPEPQALSAQQVAEQLSDSSDGEFRGFETNEQENSTVINLEISGHPPILRLQRSYQNSSRRRNNRNPNQSSSSSQEGSSRN